MAQRLEWQQVVAKKRGVRSALLSTHQDVPITPEGDTITNISSVTDLVARLCSGELSSEAVIRAYIAKLVRSPGGERGYTGVKRDTLTQRTDKLIVRHRRSLTEVMFDAAILRAQELDKYLASEGRPVGPLHGIPMTLKDQFDVKGIDSTIGYVGRAFHPAERNSTLTEMLLSLGAVIIAKTNLPQSIMWCETENPLWGLTTNPLDSRYTPGGSSGGESAILSCAGSMVGWGTDIGGSIRMPCHMMGLYGIKPTSSRLPYRGVPVSTEGQEHVPSAVGPIARSLDSIYTTLKTVIDLKPWDFDARCVAVPWREDVFRETLKRPLVIGVLLDDGVVRPHPPISRVLRSAIEALRAAGHRIVDWNPDLHAECVEVMDQFYTVDGGEDIRKAVEIGGEPFIPRVEQLINSGEPLSVFEYWQLNKRKWELQQTYLDKWKSVLTDDGLSVDVTLMPTMPHTSVPHRACRWVGYTKVWNVLDYPAMVIPGGAVNDQDLSAPWDYASRSTLDEWNKVLWTGNRDDMARLKLPVGLQIVGRRFDDERVLAAAKVLDDLLRAS
ncbi:amidase [Xylariaceae sp. FL0255]|nr:amidase [Xylariaceae sp. FL0255]